MESLPFLEDIFPPELLYACIIRSPVSRGILIDIKVPEKPDNITLITAKDIPGENKLYDSDMPILADQKLSYIGEPVAVLLGNEKTKLEEFARQCLVITENNDEKPEEPSLKQEIIIGDTLSAFENTGKIVTGSYITGIQDHWYAEPAGAASWWQNETLEAKATANVKKTSTGKTMIIRTATQWPYHVRNSVSRVLGLETSSVLVIPTALNLHMDGKLWYPSFLACLSALGVYITQKPVRLILTREEDFLYSPKRSKSNIDITSTIDEKGAITATEVNISVNLGAHMVYGKEILDQVCLGSLGMYDFKNLKVKAKAAISNIPPQGPFSGFGLSQGLFAIERHISQIACLTDVDPAEFRRNNISMLSPLKNNFSGEELIDTVTKLSDYYRKWSSFELHRKSRKGKPIEKGENPRGIGIACGFQGNGLLHYGEDKGVYGIEITLTKEGAIEIKSSLTSPEEYQKIWQKIAVEILAIQPDMVSIITNGAPDSGPSCASRNITAITKLVEKCCIAISKQRFHDPLPITVRRFVKPQGGSLRHEAWKVMDTSGFSKPGVAAAVVEITLDLIEYIPRIRGIWLVADGGKIISKHRVKRSLTRGTIQALGWAFTENIEYINGILPRKQYDNFSIFSPIDTPKIKIDFISSDLTEPKGIGELPFTCVPAAFLQAVSQAIDHCCKTIPLKRKDIWDIIRIKNDQTIKHSDQVSK
jgi:CO/xanthine dehydrogenase Mo-binding subunit